MGKMFEGHQPPYNVNPSRPCISRIFFKPKTTILIVPARKMLIKKIHKMLILQLILALFTNLQFS